MPEGPNAPDTAPTNLAILFNQIWKSLGHFHNDGSPEPPAYLEESGVWARPFDSGLQTLQRVQKGDNLTDYELWWADKNGISLAVGYARALPNEIATLDSLTTPGFYVYAPPVQNAPSGLPHGNVWVQKNNWGEVDYFYQLVFGDVGAMAMRTGSYNSQLMLEWKDWVRFSSTGGGGGGSTPFGVASFFTGITLPDASVLADGTLYYINDYPDGWATWGTKYGGDGISTFAVPDMRGQQPNFTGGVWIVSIGEDTGFNTRFYTGRGGWVGQPDLYIGMPFPA